VTMHLIPATSPDETVSVENVAGRIELRIGHTASRAALLTVAEARRLAEALMQEVEA
jgi:hypothetical protein